MIPGGNSAAAAAAAAVSRSKRSEAGVLPSSGRLFCCVCCVGRAGWLLQEGEEGVFQVSLRVLRVFHVGGALCD